LNSLKDKKDMKGTLELKELLKDLQAKRKVVLNEYLPLRDQMEEKKSLVEEVYDKSQKYRLNMKVLDSKADMETRLRFCKIILEN